MNFLLPLLCSLIINFGAIGYGDIAPNYQYLIDDCQSFLSTGNSWMQNYSRVPDEYWYAFDKGNGTYLLMFPREIPEPNYSSSETVNSLIDDYGINVTFYQYVQITYDNGRYSYVWGSPYTINIYYYSEENTLYPELLYIGRESFYFDGEYQVDLSIPDNITIPVIDGIGSLGPSSGHSIGNLPLDELSNFSWSSSHGSFALNGHSVGVSQNQSTPDFTNPIQNLLGQIIDNTNTIISNIKGVGDYLGGIASNIREGFSAIFNGISQFNNNFISFGNYIIEPLDQDLILDHVEDMSFYTLVSTINSAASHISSSINNISDNQSLIFPIDLRNTYFSNAGIMYLDLTFLDDTKSTWQPLLIAFLYITLAFNILMSLPSIIQGQSREGGKSD